MTTVNDGFNRDLNSLVKERRKTAGQALPAARAKTTIPASRGTAIQSAAAVTVLTETSRVEASFLVPAGGTVYVPTTINMRDANGNEYVYNYSQPTIE